MCKANHKSRKNHKKLRKNIDNVKKQPTRLGAKTGVLQGTWAHILAIFSWIQAEEKCEKIANQLQAKQLYHKGTLGETLAIFSDGGGGRKLFGGLSKNVIKNYYENWPKKFDFLSR